MALTELLVVFEGLSCDKDDFGERVGEPQPLLTREQQLDSWLQGLQALPVFQKLEARVLELSAQDVLSVKLEVDCSEGQLYTLQAQLRHLVARLIVQRQLL